MSQHENDLKHIRQMMERSSTFISLSGLSGVGAGLAALLGCGATFYILNQYNIDYFDGKPNTYTFEVIRKLAWIAGTTLILAIISGTWFTFQKSKKLGQSLWTPSTKNLLMALLIPLIVGGLFCLILIYHFLFYMVAPCMLIFYGLALVSASKYTQKDVFWLGFLELMLGLVAALYVGYGLVFWGFGFGFLHIAYGIWMYVKYK